MRMVNAGMNGVRVNTAYGDFTHYSSIIDNVREVADIPIVFDIKGPEIRLKVTQKRNIDKGEVIKVGFNGEAISFNHDFYDQMNIDDILYIDNGKIRAQVVKKIVECFI